MEFAELADFPDGNVDVSSSLDEGILAASMRFLKASKTFDELEKDVFAAHGEK